MNWQADDLIESAQLKELEQHAAAAGLSLIENAGKAIAHWLATKLLARGASVLVAAGQGNNGADALVAARLLHQAGHRITVWQPLAPTSPSCCEARAAFIAAGGQTSNATVPPPADILLDGLFGAGLHRPPAAPWTGILQQLNAEAWLRVAIDVPSGLNAWTGSSPTVSLRADHTLVLLAHKPGLFTADGPDHCGQLHLLEIGCDATLYPPSKNTLVSSAPPLPPRKHNSHKGSYGTTHIVGGNLGMAGAAMLAARSAMASGCGKVIIHALDERLIVDPLWPELMIQPFVPGNTFDHDVIGIGPGLGGNEAAIGAMYSVMQHQGPQVIDADALNLLAQQPAWQQTLLQRATPAILTPHPAEAARLLQTDTVTVQRNRIKAARKIAQQYASIVVLKGSGTIVSMPTGEFSIINAGNAALANAGQGDVLTGTICGLLAQGISGWQAACQASFLHARSADLYAEQHPGLVGMTASTTIELIRQQLSKITQDKCS